MKKILYIITKSGYGGAQRYVHDLVTHLPQDTFDPVVVFGGTGTRGAGTGPLKSLLETAGIRTVTVKHFMRDMSFTEDIRAFFELLRIVRKERPDVLHVTSSKAGGLGALIGRLVGVPIIVFTSHGLTFDETWRPHWQRALIKLFTWVTMLLSTITIHISRSTTTHAAALPFCRSRVHMIYNGITPPNFTPRSRARTTLLPHAPKATHKAFWIGTIAEYHPNKNLDVLISALGELHARGISAHLLLIGEGEERNNLTDRARALGLTDHVHLTGFITNAASYLKALDIFALPSRKEGLPYVLLEAGHAALPVVVSNIPGNTDIVTHGTGFVVESTPTAFANAFFYLLSSPDERSRYGQALYTHVTTSFNVERMVTATIATYS